MKKIPGVRLVRNIGRWALVHKKITIAIVVVLLLLGFIFRPKPPAPIETVTVKKNTIESTVSASGSVDSDDSVNLNFLTGGKLVYLGVKKGDEVAAGQVIATLDQRTAQKNLESALTDYSKQRTTFDKTLNDNHVGGIKDALNDNMKTILEDNQYDLNKAIISVELQDLAKESSVLTTPISGVVTRADVTTAGVNVAPTTTFTVADPGSLVFKTEVDESDIGKVHLGQPITVSLDAYPDDPLHVTVSSIDFASHTTTTGGNAYYVDAAMPESADDRYRIGMNGDAEVVLDEKKDVMTVPLSSIVDDTYVYVKGPKLFGKRKVQLGIQNDTDVEVRNGLKVGDKVALVPADVEKRQPKINSQTTSQ